MKRRRINAVAALAALVMPLAASAQTASRGNPASAFCASRGGHVEIETVDNGAQKGICVLPSGLRIDEWAYFRNNRRTTH